MADKARNQQLSYEKMQDIMQGRDFFSFDKLDDDGFLKDDQSEWEEFDNICREIKNDLTNSKDNGLGMEFSPKKPNDSQSAAKITDKQAKMQKIYSMVDNADLNLAQAERMRITKDDFFEIYGKINQEKFQAISDVKLLFYGRMKYLIAAKEYEIRCQRHLAMEGTRKTVTKLSQQINAEFGNQAKLLNKQYSKVSNQLDYYENVFKSQAS